MAIVVTLKRRREANNLSSYTKLNQLSNQNLTARLSELSILYNAQI